MLKENQIVAGDSIALLNQSPQGWVDLVFADPPFNIGYRYKGYNDKRETDDYLDFSRKWMTAVRHVLKPTGSFYLAIGDEYAADLCVIARRELGFNLRNWIIWHYTFGQQTVKKFAMSHTHILYFSMDPKEFTFNPDAVRVASARQTTYGDSRANPKGKLPDDVWYLRPQETNGEMFGTESDTWYVSRLCGTFSEREGWHGCQMPLAVLDRIIRASSNAGDLVLDPFNGSGTTIVSAALNGRRYIGIDQSAEYVEYAKKRLAHAKEQIGAAAKPNGNPLPRATNENGEASHFLFDIARSSRVQTPTDALGRPRVKRGRPRRKAAADAVPAVTDHE
jgi:site-specific DNA-methyltransferase (adenine-specific)